MAAMIPFDKAMQVTQEYLLTDLLPRIQSPMTKGVLHGIANLLPSQGGNILATLSQKYPAVSMALPVVLVDGKVNIDLLDGFAGGFFEESKLPLAALTFDHDEVSRLLSALKRYATTVSTEVKHG